MPPAPRTIFLSLLLLGALGAAAALFDPAVIDSVDALQYWAAARLLFAGHNPYDQAALQQLESSAFHLESMPVIPWTPPCVFPFTFWLGFLSFRTAAVLWFVLSCLLCAGSFALCAALFELRTRTERLPAVLFFLSCPPLALALSYGQISPLLCLAFCGFVAAGQRRGTWLDSLLAGALLSVTLIKPHLLWLVYWWLLVHSFRERSWKTLSGFVLGALALCLAPAVLHPPLLGEYLTAISAPPIYWKTPTLGSFVQALDLLPPFIARFLPTAATALAALVVFSRGSSNTGRLLALVPLSLVTAPYGWGYDQLLILPSVLYGMRRCLSFRSPAAWLPLAANAAALLLPRGTGQEFLIWYPLLAAAATAHTAEPSPPGSH